MSIRVSYSSIHYTSITRFTKKSDLIINIENQETIIKRMTKLEDIKYKWLYEQLPEGRQQAQMGVSVSGQVHL
jgi:hypothetical protein